MKKRTLGELGRETPIPEAFRKSGETAKRTGSHKLSMREIVAETKTFRRDKRARKTYVFEVLVEEDQFEDGRPAWGAHCPDLPGALTWGNTREEALEKIKEAIQLVIEVLIEEGKEIPPKAILAETESSAVVVTV